MNTQTIHYLTPRRAQAALGVQVYDLRGRLTYDSGFVNGNALSWKLRNDRGQLLANGVYLNVVMIRAWDGTILRSEVKKLVILR
jgi:hypothetical protein